MQQYVRPKSKSSEFIALIAEAKKQALKIKEEEANLPDGYRGRSDVVVLREGRTWYIEVDTCFGHASERLNIVPGIERRTEGSESESEEEIGPAARARLKGLFLSAGRQTRLLSIASSMMMQPPPKKEAQVTMVQLMEEEEESDPLLNIPMFSPMRHGPPPSVEIGHEEAVEQQRSRQQKRASVFESVTPVSNSLVVSGGIDLNAVALIQSEDEDDDDDDSPELLEGFGQRPQKRTVKVRKFVRRNKFLKKVFRRSSRENFKTVEIEDGNYGE
mmetsp:Transcript_29590/g.48830  ORF Transcript_29590/g.48830 Transcript_29590/m.48830 type:complete len:273 (+) Transcript_29590:289-1107(+)|eukprot:CAMPEP_0119016006 /NCGR_PEP_ID=MMETSP1176-20130426/11767_1 /TAXON_ID=265551 /ORGANISM="Synedropsis recta cf, Strain CCMP1620" /LENGTH=272 /DNA_ID=CAMNT_0006969331 /DNA_START=248 /DNA_END=1066 /DNA_ORIENTATION=+